MLLDERAWRGTHHFKELKKGNAICPSEPETGGERGNPGVSAEPWVGGVEPREGKAELQRTGWHPSSPAALKGPKDAAPRGQHSGTQIWGNPPRMQGLRSIVHGV